MTPPRIPPRPVEDWDAEVTDALSVLGRRRSVAEQRKKDREKKDPGPRRVPDIIGTYAQHPALARHWLTFSHHLAESTLPDRVRELLIVRTTFVCRGEYEWATHVRHARAAGMSEAEIAGLSEGPGAAVWEPGDAALVRAADELCGQRNITDETWAELEKRFSRPQLMDIVFTVCAYDLLSTAFNTFGLRPEPGAERLPPP